MTKLQLATVSYYQYILYIQELEKILAFPHVLRLRRNCWWMVEYGVVDYHVPSRSTEATENRISEQHAQGIDHQWSKINQPNFFLCIHEKDIGINEQTGRFSLIISTTWWTIKLSMVWRVVAVATVVVAAAVWSFGSRSWFLSEVSSIQMLQWPVL